MTKYTKIITQILNADDKNTFVFPAWGNDPYAKNISGSGKT